MATVFLGIAVWVLFAAAAWRYSTYNQTLHHYDRMGAAVFFAVVGFPYFVAGLALIGQPVVAN